ncbi:MAG: NAD(P)H-flavin reductase [Arsenophonus endosymbiont of Ceratovacuna japonica]
MIISSNVVSIEFITNNIYRVYLSPQGKFSFRAGQYLMIIMYKLNNRPFSLASIPSEKEIIELHIDASKFNFYASLIIKHIIAKNNINIDIPYGKAWFRENSKKPIIIIAGGTGFSYTRSILYAALEENSNRDISFYWGGRIIEQLYNLDELQLLSEKFNNLKIIPVLEEPKLDWSGRIGKVLNVVLDDFSSLIEYEIYISGRFEMAKIARERFCNERGINPEHIYGDAFEFI